MSCQMTYVKDLDDSRIYVSQSLLANKIVELQTTFSFF